MMTNTKWYCPASTSLSGPWPGNPAPEALHPSQPRHQEMGIIIDSQISMASQDNTVAATCSHTVKMLRKIFKWFSLDSSRSVRQAFFTSRLDYGNIPYTGTTTKLTNKCQAVQNSAANSYSISIHGHTSPSLTPHLEVHHFQSPHIHLRRHSTS